MADVLIVDGYNIINHWEELDNIKRENLEDARKKLITILSSYAGFKGYLLIIVFDAHFAASKEETWERPAPDVHIVFTKRGETADTVIERLSYEMQHLHVVRVATSDKEEQFFVLGKGAARLSARDLQADVKRVLKNMHKQYKNNPGKQKSNAVANSLDPQIRKQLERLRRGK